MYRRLVLAALILAGQRIVATVHVPATETHHAAQPRLSLRTAVAPGGTSAPCWWWTRPAMLDSRVTGELLAEAKSAGAKVILAGDDRQLASIERGGLFTKLRRQHGAAEITEVTRQKGLIEDTRENHPQAEAVSQIDGVRKGSPCWTRERSRYPIEIARFGCHRWRTPFRTPRVAADGSVRIRRHRSARGDTSST